LVLLQRKVVLVYLGYSHLPRRKGEGTITLHASWKYSRRNRRRVTVILNLSAKRGERSISCSVRFFSGKQRWYPLSRRLDGPCSQSGRFWRRCLAPAAVRTPDRPRHI